MAFDGVTIACVISELKKELIGGRLYKIAQPENDELLLTIKQPTGQKRLLLSASASLPLIYLTLVVVNVHRFFNLIIPAPCRPPTYVCFCANTCRTAVL